MANKKVTKAVAEPKAFFLVEGGDVEYGSSWTNIADLEDYMNDMEIDDQRVALYEFKGFATVKKTVSLEMEK